MKTVLNVKIDKDVKIKAQKTALKLGLPLSLVVGEHLRRFAAAESIVFGTPKKMSKKLARLVAEAEVDLKKDKNLSPVFHSGSEMDRYLNSL